MKRHDRIAVCQVRLGICHKDKALIDKGLFILETIEEIETLKVMKSEVEKFYCH